MPGRTVATPANRKATLRGGFSVGWGGRIRTDECQSQSLVPYRLATPQFMDLYPNSIPQIRLRVKTFPLFFRFFAFFAAQ